MTMESIDRYHMGMRGRAWMAREFGWERIANEMTEVYTWLLADDGSIPSCLRLD
jgi:hypothetical protein